LAGHAEGRGEEISVVEIGVGRFFFDEWYWGAVPRHGIRYVQWFE